MEMKTLENYGQVKDEYSLIEMCGRMVQVKNRKEDGTSCADCGQDARYTIKEEKGDPWCYCGTCCIGG